MKIDYYKPNLPDIDIYQSYLNKIWNSKWLTNNGEHVLQLEKKLAAYLQADHVVLVSSGTIGLQLAIHALNFENNILTTPFSFIASTSSLLWEKCRTINSDILADNLHMDFSQQQYENINGILPVQIFGIPLPDDFQSAGLPVLIDGAHSFGVFKNKQSILNQGDISMVSLHATKFFHTVEGGAIVTNNKLLADKVKSLRNFGWNEKQTTISNIGINAKMSELHAAMGLSLFDKIDTFKEKNKFIYNQYLQALSGKQDLFYLPNFGNELDYHYAYFPMIFYTKEYCNTFINYLEKKEIGYKRYFNIPLNRLPFVDNAACPVAESICDRIVSLPVYFEMKNEEIEYVCESLQHFTI